MARRSLFFGGWTHIDGIRNSPICPSWQSSGDEIPPEEMPNDALPKPLQMLIWNRKKLIGKHRYRGPIGKLSDRSLARLKFWEILAERQGVTLTAEQILEDAVEKYAESKQVPRPNDELPING